MDYWWHQTEFQISTFLAMLTLSGGYIIEILLKYKIINIQDAYKISSLKITIENLKEKRSQCMLPKVCIHSNNECGKMVLSNLGLHTFTHVIDPFMLWLP